MCTVPAKRTRLFCPPALAKCYSDSPETAWISLSIPCSRSMSASRLTRLHRFLAGFLIRRPQELGNLVLRALRVITRALRLGVFVDRTLPLTRDIEDLAQIDVGPD